MPACNAPGRALTPMITALVVTLSACAYAADPPPPAKVPTAFPSPEGAVEALIAAAKKSDATATLAIFGAEARDILSSGDAVQDRRARDVFVVATGQRWKLEETDPDHRNLIIGNEQWPFPIPLVRQADGWRFDTDAGKREVRARRIGRNELAAIGMCNAYVIAQKQYAAEARDGNPSGRYAQKFRSTPDRHDGLFWPTKPGEKRSPLGDLAAMAASEGYTGGGAAGPKPLRGYYFRILTQQGASAPGGAKTYVVDGHLTAGFAVIAYPAEYGNSGIMTFIVNQEGTVHEADLGPETAKLAAAITAYDPDGRFRPAE